MTEELENALVCWFYAQKRLAQSKKGIARSANIDIGLLRHEEVGSRELLYAELRNVIASVAANDEGHCPDYFPRAANCVAPAARLKGKSVSTAEHLPAHRQSAEIVMRTLKAQADLSQQIILAAQNIAEIKTTLALVSQLEVRLNQ